MRFIAAFLALTAVPLLVRGGPPAAPPPPDGAKVQKDDKGAKPGSDGGKDLAKARLLEKQRRKKLAGYEVIYMFTTNPAQRSAVAERIKELSQQPEPAPQPQPGADDAKDAAEARRLAEKKRGYAILAAMGLGSLLPEVVQNQQAPAPPKELTPEEKKEQQLRVFQALFGPNAQFPLPSPASEPAPSGPRTDSREYERSKNNY
jgi:hypothetical protein